MTLLNRALRVASIALLLYGGQCAYVFMVSDGVIGEPRITAKALLFPFPIQFALVLMCLWALLRLLGPNVISTVVASLITYGLALWSIIWAQTIDDRYSLASDPYGRLFEADVQGHVVANVILMACCGLVALLLIRVLKGRGQGQIK